jgi:hypothetical protein
MLKICNKSNITGFCHIEIESKFYMDEALGRQLIRVTHLKQTRHLKHT